MDFEHKIHLQENTSSKQRAGARKHKERTNIFQQHIQIMQKSQHLKSFFQEKGKDADLFKVLLQK